MMVVIGSGPAGVACASALLGAGADVCMLDGGQDLAPSLRSRLEDLARRPATEWDDEAVGFLKGADQASTSGIPMKYAYGSSYPYDDPVGHTMVTGGADTTPSWARGGLSSVWGAAMLPYRDADIEAWPVNVADLAEHYAAVLRFVPVSGRRDRLAELFPLYTDRLDALPTSAQAERLLDEMERVAEPARRRGVWFGASRLAVRASASDAGPGCARCGLCLYGCPHELIYNSVQTVRSLLASPRFSYRPGVVVATVHEENGRARLSGTAVPSGDHVEVTADKIFIGAGVLGTTRVMLASREAWDQPVTMRDSCYYLLPILRFRGAPAARDEARHTMAQAFVEILDPSVSPHTVHLQLYTYNELFRSAVRGLLGSADRALGASIDRSLLSRLLLFQGYLHSDQSPTVSVALSAPDAQQASTLVLRANDEPATRPVLRALVRKLRAERSMLGAVPAGPLLRIGRPGRGFHSGGTFPMRTRPEAFETDRLGRLGGTGNVHLIDSAVFPTVPATTITLTVMANAHRIGTEALA